MMKYARLGNTDLNVSQICLGTVFRSEPDEASCVAAIHEAADWGCNYLDGANLYRDGVSEQIIGRASRGRASRAHRARRPQRVSTAWSGTSVVPGRAGGR